MGSLAEFYAFSLIHGKVQTWQPADLGTPSASLSFSMKPARTPLIDTQSNPQDEFCSATPPNCDAVQSGLDVLSASLDMDFDQDGDFAAFTGAYFGLEGAVAGFVEPVLGQNPSLKATLGGPHFEDDGTTLNVGSMQAFLSDSVLQTIFGVAPGDPLDLSVSRTDAGNEEDADFDVVDVPGGVEVLVNEIGFSTPVYNITSGDEGSGDADGPFDPASYRLFAADGGVFNYGEFKHNGSAANLKLAKPIVGGASSFGADGYWLVAADGGVFAYGAAPFAGSAAALPLNSPIVGISPNVEGEGYYLVAADGGVFAFGGANSRDRQAAPSSTHR